MVTKLDDQTEARIKKPSTLPSGRDGSNAAGQLAQHQSPGCGEDGAAIARRGNP
jgi:hypothetical protein